MNDSDRASSPTPSRRRVWKKPGADIKKQYTPTLYLGMTLSLLTILAVVRAPFNPDDTFEVTTIQQEVIEMEMITPTEQMPRAPLPPRPPTPVAVPDEVILEDTDFDFDASLNIDEEITYLPAPPPPPAVPVEEEEEEPEIFVIVQQPPRLIGGLETLQARMVYPPLAVKAGVEGRVYVQFVVDEEGRVVDPVVVRGIGAGCDEEALRVLKEARFEPGRQRGRAVKVRYSIPITFRLRDRDQ